MGQLPDWFKPVLEYIALMQAYGFSLDDINRNLKAVYDNFFIQTCDEETISQWEHLFGIVNRYDATLDYRRAVLLQKFSQTAPYTLRHFTEKLTELFGDDYTLTIDYENCVMRVFVTSDRYGAIDLLYDLIWAVVPVHLRVIANQQTTNFVVSDQYIGGFTTNTFAQTIAPGGN